MIADQPQTNTKPALRLCEKAELYIEKDNDWFFDHTKLILHSDDDKTDEYHCAKTNHRLFQISELDIHALDAIPIPASHIYPLFDPKFTLAPDPLPPNTYPKRHSLLNYEKTDNPDCGSAILAEADACEVLARHPHPNMARYLGCVVKDGRIRRLCFERYAVTLAELLNDGTPFDRRGCLRGIEAGMRHMHCLGLVHNDLNPANVMLEGGRCCYH